MPLPGSKEFIEALLRQSFQSPNDEVDVMNGCDVNGHALTVSGFTRPIVVPLKEGLRMKVPLSSFSEKDLLIYIEPGYMVDVIDVRAQCEVQMTLGELVKNFATEDRGALLNMLSLEFSRTKLSKLVEPPHVVSELSLINNCWVVDASEESYSDDPESPENHPHTVPSVQKYCLLSMKGSYTDFHIDFGGSSVWYHVLWGEKIFYLIPPTSGAQTLFWKWSVDPGHREIFFPDLLPRRRTSHEGECPKSVSPVLRLHLLPGQTILLPSGWIHAVYTVSDCLVFGGNFLCELHIPMQISVYRMEQKLDTPVKFQFPNFEKVHWFVADRIAGRLTNALYDDQDPLTHDLEAARCLAKALPRWYNKRHMLPLDQRNYYMPSRATLELSWIDLIERLKELVHSFMPRSKKNPKGMDQAITCEGDNRELKKRQHHRFHPGIKLTSSSEDFDYSSELAHPTHKFKHRRLEEDTVDEPIVPRSARSRCDRMPSKILSPKANVTKLSKSDLIESEAITEDPEVLEAVPELSSSKLIGDHYFLSLSESDEESSPTRRSKPYRKIRDPDPTWSAGSPTHRKLGSRNFRSPERLLSPNTPKMQLSGLLAGSRTLHPLLQHRSPADGASTSRGLPTHGGSDSASSAAPRGRRKATSTVRQRLAKRLGL